jgi:hypothetical protein
MWTKAYGEALDTWSKSVEQAVSTDEFAAVSGELLRRYVQFQEAVRRTSQATADALHLPTRDDVASLAQLVINVERKVDEVSDELDALVRRAPAGPDPEIAVLGGRLSAIEARLEGLGAIEAKIDALARAVAASAPPPAPAAAEEAPPAAPAKAAAAPARKAAPAAAAKAMPAAPEAASEPSAEPPKEETKPPAPRRRAARTPKTKGGS